MTASTMTASSQLSDGLLSLSEQPQFKNCHQRHIVIMLAHTELVEVQAGETVCESLKTADYLWFQLDGMLKCHSPDGKSWQQQQGFIGEEAALTLKHYYNSAVAEQPSKLLRIPAHSVAKPEQQNQDTRVGAMLSTLFSGTNTVKPLAKIERELSYFTLAKNLIGWILALMLPWLIMEYGHTSSYFSDDPGERWRQIRLSAILVCGGILWGFALVKPYIAGLFMLLLTLVIELVPSTTILSGFASNAFFMTLSLFGLSAVILHSGLLLRLALWLLQHFPNSLMLRHMATSIVMFAMTLLLPSNKVRIRLWSSLYPLIFSEVHHQPARQQHVIAFILFVSITLFAPLLLTGSGANLLLYGLLPHQSEINISWLSWFEYAFAAAIVVIGGLLLMQWFYYRKHPQINIAAQLQQRVQVCQQVLGKKSIIDKALLIVLVGYIGSIVFSDSHRIDHRLLSLVILTLFLLSNVLDRFHINHTMDWHFLILLGACVGLMKCVEDLQLATVLNNLLPSLSQLIVNQPISFTILLGALATICSTVLARGSILLGFIAIPLSVSNGFNPWVTIFVILMMDQCWLHINHAPVYQYFQQHLLQQSRNQDIIRWQLANICLRVTAIAVSIPLWQHMELI